MDNNKKQVKPSRNFDFKKSKEKRFDFTKDDDGGKRKKSYKMIYIIGLIIVIGTIGTLCISPNFSSSDKQEVVNDTIAAVTEINESKLDDNNNVEVINNDDSKMQDHEKVTVIETTSSTLNLDEKVLSVIRGNYGNNPERRRKLGAEYQIIQDKVNEMYRNGLVR